MRYNWVSYDLRSRNLVRKNSTPLKTCGVKCGTQSATSLASRWSSLTNGRLRTRSIFPRKASRLSKKPLDPASGVSPSRPTTLRNFTSSFTTRFPFWDNGSRKGLPKLCQRSKNPRAEKCLCSFLSGVLTYALTSWCRHSIHSRIHGCRCSWCSSLYPMNKWQDK